MYRFVNRRKMTDEVCREAAAVAFAISRPFEGPSAGGSGAEEERQRAEGQEGEMVKKDLGELNALDWEEKDWPKRTWEEEKYKGEWSEGITVDERITQRMRKFFVPSHLEPKVEGVKKEGKQQ